MTDGTAAPAAPVAAPVTPAAVDPGAAPAAPAAAPAPAPAEPSTLAGGAPASPQITVPVDFPANWRETMAGDDKAFLQRLQRFDNPAAVAKSYRELEGKVSSGQLKPPAAPLPANATPEQAAAWRAEQGLPANAEAFLADLKLDGGVVPGEADKPMLASFAEAAFKNNWSKDQYNQAVGWYFGLQDNLVAERRQQDSTFMRDATAELGREWGNDFGRNQTAVSSFLEGKFPAEFRDALLNARTPDGDVLGNHPMFNRAILAMAKEFNPASTLLPNAAGSTLSNVDTRISEIEAKHMRAPQGSPEWRQYWQGPLADEYRNLIGAREQMRERSRG